MSIAPLRTCTTARGSPAALFPSTCTRTPPQAAVHTHDISGAVWLEGRDTGPITLGQFFAVWGVRFDDRCLGATCGGVRVQVDGTSAPGDPRAVVLVRSGAIDVTVSSA